MMVGLYPAVILVFSCQRVQAPNNVRLFMAISGFDYLSASTEMMIFFNRLSNI